MSALAAFALSTFAAALLALDGADLPAPPGVDELLEANEKIETVFGDQIRAAKSAASKAELAEELLKSAGTERDSATKYALFRKAKDLAMRAGDMSLALDAVRAIAGSFGPPDGVEPSEFISRGNKLWTSAAKQRMKSAATIERLEAVEWYLRAEPSATGLDKTLIEKRLRELVPSSGKHESKLSKSVVGVWDHVAVGSPLRMRMELLPSGDVRFIESNHDNKDVTCKWRVDGDEFDLVWSNGYTDRCVLDQSKQQYTGTNNSGVTVRGSRVKPEKAR